MSTTVIVDVEAAAWAPMLPGVAAKTVWVDEASNRRALLIRFDAGAALSRHVHNGDEVLYVLDGTVSDDHGTVTAGNVGYRPPGCTHTVRTETGATVFAVVSGGVAPVGEGVRGGPPSQVHTVADHPEVEALPGVFLRTVWADGATDRKALVVRFTPGSALQPHRHVGDELIYVLDGTVADEAGQVTAGNAAFRPDGCEHVVRSEGGATVFALVRGGVEPLA